MIHRIILTAATGNAHKLRELRQIFSSNQILQQFHLLAPQEQGLTLPNIDENGATFIENALLKARRCAASWGKPCIADDSGLCVDVLGGEPGVRSARWAGPTDRDRIDALLNWLQSVPLEQRGARFVCAAAFASPDGELTVSEADCQGSILFTPRPGTDFGYDPIFWVPEENAAMSELSSEQKNAISHRGRAFRLLGQSLLSMLGTNEG